MISSENFEKLSKQYQMGVFPNVVREYFQHVFLAELQKLPEAEKLLFKGGTALRLVYKSPRFSEDLDFSLFDVPQDDIKAFMENLFVKVLAEIERSGIKTEIGERSQATTGGYFGIATFHILDYPPVGVEINISFRDTRVVKGEIDTVINDFVPTYTMTHLPQQDIVEEKVFDALIRRHKPRDYYDLYFMMRAGMLSADQKQRLNQIATQVIDGARHIDFQGELGAFLPANQQAIIRDFPQTLEREMRNQLSFNAANVW